MDAILIVEAGQADPNLCKLVPGTSVRVGRSPENEIVLRDEHASRFHAEIFQQNDDWLIRDAGGRNGTRVNGETINGPTPLTAGSIIQVGKTSMRFAQQVDDKIPATIDVGPETSSH